MSWALWHEPVIPAPWRQRQVDTHGALAGLEPLIPDRERSSLNQSINQSIASQSINVENA